MTPMAAAGAPPARLGATTTAPSPPAPLPHLPTASSPPSPPPSSAAASPSHRLQPAPPPVPTVPLTVTSAADAAAVYAVLFPVNGIADDAAAAATAASAPALPAPPPPPVATPVVGGITNHIWRVARAGGDGHRGNGGGGGGWRSPSSSSPTVLVRAFGPVPGLDRAAENRVVAALAAAGVAPPLYALTSNGRVEGWHTATRPATVDDLPCPGVYVPLARALAALHAVDAAVGGGGGEGHGGGGGGKGGGGSAAVGDGLWRRIGGWTAAARRVPAVVATAAGRLDAIDTAASRVRVVLTHRYPPPPLVLCHNDLLAANVLLRWGEEIGRAHV